MKINKRKIGYEFEKEANEYLKNIFDKVEWLSQNKKSSLDFKCIKDKVVYFGDAKVTSSTKPSLYYSQKDADFIIAKIRGNIIMIYKNEFPKKVNMRQDGEITTIQIYYEDLKIITDDCMKNENLRDKLHEIIQEWKK